MHRMENPMQSDSTGLPAGRTLATLLAPGQGAAELTPTMRQALALIADNGACLTWTITEAAAFLGVSVSYYYRAAHRGDLPATKVGDRLLVYKAALLRMLEAHAFLASLKPKHSNSRGRRSKAGEAA